MKCEKHPDSDAVGVCISCGRGVCSICKINYSNMIHCKECIETGRIGSQKQVAQAGYYAQGAPPAQQAYGTTYPYSYPYYGYGYGYGGYGYGWGRRVYQAKPKPKGIPNPTLFKVGSAGCVLTAIFSILLGIIFMWSIINYYVDPGQMFMIFAFLVMLTSFPLAVGVYGFYKNYGTEWGLLGSISLVITSTLFFVLYVAAMMYPMRYSSGPNIMYIYFGNLCFGIGIFLTAVAVHHAKPYLKAERLAQGLVQWATGGLVIGGILLMAFIGMFMAGWAVVAISLLLVALEMYKAPTPDLDAEGDEASKTPDWAQATGQAPTTPMGTGMGGPTPAGPGAPTVKTINCPKCRTMVEVTDPKRPIEVKCNSCGSRLLVKK